MFLKCQTVKKTFYHHPLLLNLSSTKATAAPFSLSPTPTVRPRSKCKLSPTLWYHLFRNCCLQPRGSKEYIYLAGPRGCCSGVLGLEMQSQAQGGQGPPGNHKTTQDCPFYYSRVRGGPRVISCLIIFMGWHMCYFYIIQKLLKGPHPSNIIQPQKRSEFLHPYSTDETWGHRARERSQAPGRQILHDSTYVRYPESSDSQKQKVAWWLPWVTDGKQEFLFNKNRVSVFQDENILEIGCVMMWMCLTLLS